MIINKNSIEFTDKTYLIKQDGFSIDCLVSGIAQELSRCIICQHNGEIDWMLAPEFDDASGVTHKFAIVNDTDNMVKFMVDEEVVETDTIRNIADEFIMQLTTRFDDIYEDAKAEYCMAIYEEMVEETKGDISDVQRLLNLQSAS